MLWKDFFQLIIIYPLFLGSLIYSIILLDDNGLDTYFLITFILAILTIILAIYYSGKTNEVFEKITEKIHNLKEDNQSIKTLICNLEGKIDKSDKPVITDAQITKIDEAIKKSEEKS